MTKMTYCKESKKVFILLNQALPFSQQNSTTIGQPLRDKTECQILSEITGHYKIVDHKPKIVSALGSIPKRNSQDQTDT